MKVPSAVVGHLQANIQRGRQAGMTKLPGAIRHLCLAKPWNTLTRFKENEQKFIFMYNKFWLFKIKFP